MTTLAQPENNTPAMLPPPTTTTSTTETAKKPKVFAVGNIVQVEKRTWPGINKLGGVGRITAVHNVGDDDNVTVDVRYLLGSSERGIDVVFVSLWNAMGEKRSRGRSTATTCTTSTSNTPQEAAQGEGEKSSGGRISLRKSRNQANTQATTDDKTKNIPAGGSSDKKRKRNQPSSFSIAKTQAVKKFLKKQEASRNDTDIQTNKDEPLTKKQKACKTSKQKKQEIQEQGAISHTDKENNKGTSSGGSLFDGFSRFATKKQEPRNRKQKQIPKKDQKTKNKKTTNISTTTKQQGSKNRKQPKFGRKAVSDLNKDELTLQNEQLLKKQQKSQKESRNCNESSKAVTEQQDRLHPLRKVPFSKARIFKKSQEAPIPPSPVDSRIGTIVIVDHALGPVPPPPVSKVQKAMQTSKLNATKETNNDEKARPKSADDAGCGIHRQPTNAVKPLPQPPPDSQVMAKLNEQCDSRIGTFVIVNHDQTPSPLPPPPAPPVHTDREKPMLRMQHDANLSNAKSKTTKEFDGNNICSGESDVNDHHHKVKSKEQTLPQKQQPTPPDPELIAANKLAQERRQRRFRVFSNFLHAVLHDEEMPLSDLLAKFQALCEKKGNDASLSKPSFTDCHDNENEDGERFTREEVAQYLKQLEEKNVVMLVDGILYRI